jgi:hypothetical protein
VGQRLVGSLLLAALGLLFLPTLLPCDWVGDTDLEVEFVVRDTATGEPVPGATLQVHSEGGLCAERERQDFSLVADPAGRVKRLCRNCLCFGTRGWNIDTYVVHLPWWFYQAKAPGYRPSALLQLDVPEYVRQVQRGRPFARLVVRVPLERSRP